MQWWCGGCEDISCGSGTYMCRYMILGHLDAFSGVWIDNGTWRRSMLKQHGVVGRLDCWI